MKTLLQMLLISLGLVASLAASAPLRATLDTDLMRALSSRSPHSSDR